MNASSINPFIFYLGCYGLTTLIVQSRIFKPVRELFQTGVLHNLLNCMMCTSFWVGLVSVLLLQFSPTVNLLLPNTDPSNIQFIYSILFDSFSVVGVVWFIYILQSFFEDQLKREL